MAKQRFRDIKKGIVKKEKKKEKIVPFATNWQKTKSALTDTFMLLMPIMYGVVYIVMGSREEFRDNMLMGWIDILIPFIAIQSAFFYFGDGQTPGYKNYDLRVVDISTLERPPLIKIVIRNILMVFALISILGWAIMFIRKDKRGLHDILSDTAVINIKKI